MRFRGSGAGHLSTREATRKFEEEAERLAGFRQITAGDEEGEIEAPREDVAEREGAGDRVEDAGSDGSAFSDGDQGSGDEEVEEVGEEDLA